MKILTSFAIVLMVCVAAGAQTAGSSSDDWVGCYRIQVVHADPQLEVLAELLWPEPGLEMPRTFHLYSKTAFVDGGNEYKAVSDEGWLISYWQWSPGLITVGWGTGFVGYDIQWTGFGDVMPGIAFWTTDDAPPAFVGDIEIHRIACDTSPPMQSQKQHLKTVE